MAVTVSYRSYMDRNPKSYILKELCFVEVETNRFQPADFNAAYMQHEQLSRQKITNTWLMKNCHGLKWTDGYLPHNEKISKFFEFF
jgi:hypothetical protein